MQNALDSCGFSFYENRFLVIPFVNDTCALFGASGKHADFNDLYNWSKADLAFYLFCNAVTQLLEVNQAALAST